MFSSPIAQRQHQREQKTAPYKSDQSILSFPSPSTFQTSINIEPFGHSGKKPNLFGGAGARDDLRRPLGAFSTNVQTLTSPLSSPSPSRSIFFTHMPPSPPETPKHTRFDKAFEIAYKGTCAPKSKMMQQVEQKRQTQAQARSLAKTAEQRTRERREGFLYRVREKQDSRRWDARSDQILHDDYITQKRAWEEELAKSAPTWDIDSADDVPHHEPIREQYQQSGLPMAEQQTDVNMTAIQPDQDISRDEEEAEIEALLDAEARELDALVALHEASQTNNRDDEEDLYNEDLDGGWWSDLHDISAAVDPTVSSPRYGSGENESDDWVKGFTEDSNTGDAMDIS